MTPTAAPGKGRETLENSSQPLKNEFREAVMNHPAVSTAQSAPPLSASIDATLPNVLEKEVGEQELVWWATSLPAIEEKTP